MASSIRRILLAAGLALVVTAPAVAQPMMTYQFVFFRVGPNKDVPPAQAQSLMKDHLTQLGKLNSDRINVLYGPFQDAGDLRGIAILDVTDAATALKHFADDPYVKAGHMVLDVKPWMGPKGWFQPPDNPATPEQFVFGFLMRGTATGQSTAEAQAIQKGHLAYMDELHKQGKLVAAGPFADNSDYRGIVIYRVATVEEARKLAAEDPAVKAGRLRIEARPWMTFKGILK